MALTLLRLDQIRKPDEPDDTLTGTQVEGIESSAVDKADFMKGVLSQFKRIIHGDDSGNWFDDIADVFTTPTSLKALHSRATLEAKNVLTNRLNLNDVSVGAAAKATGYIDAVSKAELANGEEFAINDGTRTVHFIFDVSGSYTPGGGYDATHVRMDVSGCTDVDSVIDVIVPAINGATIDVTAAEGTSPRITLQHDNNGGYNYTITETVTDTDFAVSGMSGGAGGNSVNLSSTQKPDKIIAIATSSQGAVTAQLSGGIGANSLIEISGSNSLKPKNLCYIFDGATGDPVKSEGRRIYGLLQVGSAAVDGNAFGDSGDDQGQISFVRPNAAYNDLEACPVADIAGKSVIYAFTWREDLADLPEDAFRGDLESADPEASTTVSLDSAYDGGHYMTIDGQDVDIRLSDTKSWVFRAGSGGSALVTITRNDSSGDEMQLDLDILDINNATTVDFLNGAAFDTGGTTVNVGVTAGQIDASALELEATIGDLSLVGADDITFKTVRETSALPLDDGTTGKISTLWSQSFASIAAAIKYAGDHGGVDLSLKVSVLGSSYAKGDNIPGAVQDITAYPIDMNTPANTKQFVFLNGRLLYGGNGSTKNDVYVGTTAGSGDIKVEFDKGVKTGDVIISLVLTQ